MNSLIDTYALITVDAIVDDGLMALVLLREAKADHERETETDQRSAAAVAFPSKCCAINEATPR